MNEEEVAAAGILADRMLAAMQRTSQALENYDSNDRVALRHLSRPGTSLHVAASAYMAYLKGAGLRPEQVLVLVKQSVGQFERIPHQIEVRPLTDAVISLCIEEYYLA